MSMTVFRKTLILYPNRRNIFNAILGLIKKTYTYTNSDGNVQAVSWPPYEEPENMFEESSPESQLGRLIVAYLESLQLLRPGSLFQTAGLSRRPKYSAFQCSLKLRITNDSTLFAVMLNMMFVRDPTKASLYITSEEVSDYLEELITTGKLTSTHNLDFHAKFATLRLCYIDGSINGLRLDF